MIMSRYLPAGQANKVGEAFCSGAATMRTGIIHESLAVIQIRLWVQVIKNVSHCGSSEGKYTFGYIALTMEWLSGGFRL